MGGIVECRAQRTVADLADPAGVIDFAELMEKSRGGLCVW
jgi:hypothetical protein